MLFMISRPQEEGHYIQCPKAGYYFFMWFIIFGCSSSKSYYFRL